MRKLAAIMFSDIAGYSAMMSKDEKQALGILEKNRAIHKALISKNNGSYIKEIGDGTLAIFQSAFDAVHCALLIMNACSREPAFKIRIGIHIGDVVLQDNDVFGDSVNIASRIEAAGEPGGIFISEKVYDDIKNKEGISAEFYGEKILKNIPDPVKIYRISSADIDYGSNADYNTPEPNTGKTNQIKNRNRMLIFSALLIALIFAAIFYFFPVILKQDKLQEIRTAEGRISVAVFPFYNMTNDSTWNVWQEGIQDMLISSLSNSEELQVRQFESVNSILQSKGVVNYASITPSLGGTISQKLDASVFIFGNIKKAGQSLRISAQLIDSKTQEVFKSFQVEGSDKEENLFALLDSFTKMVNDFLVISRMEKELTPDFQRLVSTKSPDAYRHFILGKNAFMKQDFNSAKELYTKALAVDSTFTFAGIMLSLTNFNLGNLEETEDYFMSIYEKRERESYLMKLMIDWWYALLFETPHEEIKYLKQLIEIDDQNPMFHYQLGFTYTSLDQFSNAIPEYEKALEIYRKWETKPGWIFHYTGLIHSYFNTNQFEKMNPLIESADRDFPGERTTLYWFTVYNFSIKDTTTANAWLDKLLAAWRANSRPESAIAMSLGNIYSTVKDPEKAEYFYRKAYSLDPENPVVLNSLGFFLADSGRGIDEGLALLTRALELSPGDYLLFDSKGWALYKKGNAAEALDLIQKSWDSAPYYNHEIYTHLQEVKGVVKEER